MLFNGKNTDLGLLLLRIGFGIIYILHGFPKVTGGPDRWIEVGSAMGSLGIRAFYEIFGFLAGSIEFFGGILLLFGVFTVPAVILLLCTMVVALISKIAAAAGYAEIAYPLMAITVFITLLVTGPGKISMDYKINSRRRLY